MGWWWTRSFPGTPRDGRVNLAAVPTTDAPDPANDTLFAHDWFALAGDDAEEWRAVAAERAAAKAGPAATDIAAPALAPAVPSPVPSAAAPSFPVRAPARGRLPSWLVVIVVAAGGGGLLAWFVATAAAVAVVVAFG